MGVPQNRWFIMEFLLKWMIWGYPISGNPHVLLHSQCVILSCSSRCHFLLNIFSPPASWGLLDFISDARLLLLPPSSSSFRAGPHLPALDRSEPRRISSAALDSNGPRRTSTGKGLSAVGLAGLQPARVAINPMSNTIPKPSPVLWMVYTILTWFMALGLWHWVFHMILWSISLKTNRRI